MKSTNNRYILSAMLIALSVTMGYAFIAIPNVELLTATIFISGYVIGPVYGLAVGLLAELIYSLFNPLGAPIPLLLVAQVVSMALVGFVGGLLGKSGWYKLPVYLKMISLGFVGFLLTLLFDVMTTLSFAIFMAGTDVQKILSSFFYGMTFYGIHLVVNTLIFVIFVPLILVRLKTHIAV